MDMINWRFLKTQVEMEALLTDVGHLRGGASPEVTSVACVATGICFFTVGQLRATAAWESARAVFYDEAAQTAQHVHDKPTSKLTNARSIRPKSRR